MYADLAFGITAAVPASYDEVGFKTLFATETNAADATPVSGEFVRVKNVREFPAMGTPPNIVNVPTYGSKTSFQVQGQSDAPTMEITVNYIAADYDKTSGIGKFVGDGVKRAFRFALLNSKPASYSSTVSGIGTKAAEDGGGANENTVFYWMGKIEAMVVNPQLTDAVTATLTLSIQSDFYGAYTTSA